MLQRELSSSEPESDRRYLAVHRVEADGGCNAKGVAADLRREQSQVIGAVRMRSCQGGPKLDVESFPGQILEALCGVHVDAEWCTTLHWKP